MVEINPAAIGLAVKTAREGLKMTANDLSAQTGIPPSSLSRTERGARMPPLNEASSIARALGMSVQDLMDRAVELEQSGAVKAQQDFQRAIAEAKAAIDAAVENLNSTKR